MAGKEIVTRPHLGTQAIMIMLIGFATYGILSRDSSFGLEEWAVTIILPPGVLLAFVVMPNAYVTFSKNGISSFWYMGIGPWRLWNRKMSHFVLPWSNIVAIYEIPPAFPPHLIIIEGFGQKPTGKIVRRMIFWGTMFTQAEETLLFMEKHLGDSLMDKNVRKLLSKAKEPIPIE